MRQVTLVDAAGTQLKDAEGKPIVKHLDDCDADHRRDRARAAARSCSSTSRHCKGKPDKTVCANKAVADVGGLEHQRERRSERAQIVLVTEVPLTTSDGTPVKDKKSGQPIVKKLADARAATDPDTCRELFLRRVELQDQPARRRASTAACKERVSTWVDANASE